MTRAAERRLSRVTALRPIGSVVLLCANPGRSTHIYWRLLRARSRTRFKPSSASSQLVVRGWLGLPLRTQGARGDGGLAVERGRRRWRISYDSGGWPCWRRARKFLLFLFAVGIEEVYGNSFQAALDRAKEAAQVEVFARGEQLVLDHAARRRLHLAEEDENVAVIQSWVVIQNTVGAAWTTVRDQVIALLVVL